MKKNEEKLDILLSFVSMASLHSSGHPSTVYFFILYPTSSGLYCCMLHCRFVEPAFLPQLCDLMIQK